VRALIDFIKGAFQGGMVYRAEIAPPKHAKTHSPALEN
jgi:hypothetical protein